MMTVCHPRFATTRHAFSVCWPYQSMTLTSSMMDLFLFRVPSTLWTGTGFGRGQVSSSCFWMGGGTAGGNGDTGSCFFLGVSVLSDVPCIGCDLVGDLQ